MMDEVKYQARSLAEAVYRYSVLIPERNAIVDKQGPHTYAQLWEEIAQCAEVLKELGVKKGDRVVMECSQDALFLSVNLSCQLLEAIFVGVERRVARGRLEDIVRQTEPALLLTAKAVEQPEDAKEAFYRRNLTVKEFAQLLKKQRENQVSGQSEMAGSGLPEPCLPSAVKAVEHLDRETVSEILFSTGTTGKTKGAILTNRANVANAQHLGKHDLELLALVGELAQLDRGRVVGTSEEVWALAAVTVVKETQTFELEVFGLRGLWQVEHILRLEPALNALELVLGVRKREKRAFAVV